MNWQSYFPDETTTSSSNINAMAKLQEMQEEERKRKEIEQRIKDAQKYQEFRNLNNEPGAANTLQSLAQLNVPDDVAASIRAGAGGRPSSPVPNTPVAPREQQAGRLANVQAGLDAQMDPEQYYNQQFGTVINEPAVQGYLKQARGIENGGKFDAIAKQWEDMGPENKAVGQAFRTLGQLNPEQLDAVKGALGTSLGGIGLEGVEQAGRITLADKEQAGREKIQNDKFDFERQENALNRAMDGLKLDDSKKKLKADQYKVGTFALRIEGVEDILQELDTAGYDPGSIKNAVLTKQGLAAVRDPQARKYAQAMRNFVNSNLRRESGAVISDSEFDSAYRQYFGEIGDDAETLSQKRDNRLRVLAGMKAEAGDALEEIRGMYKTEVSRYGGRKSAAGNSSMAPDEVDSYLKKYGGR